LYSVQLYFLCNVAVIQCVTETVPGLVDTPVIVLTQRTVLLMDKITEITILGRFIICVTSMWWISNTTSLMCDSSWEMV